MQKWEVEAAAQGSEGGQKKKSRKRKRKAAPTVAGSTNSDGENESDDQEPVQSNLVLPQVNIPAGPTAEELEQGHPSTEALLSEILDNESSRSLDKVYLATTS